MHFYWQFEYRILRQRTREKRKALIEKTLAIRISYPLYLGTFFNHLEFIS
jgi:hypothetical protein